MPSFIESPNFPIHIVNEASAKEKQGGGRPPHWEMVFWWTRKPLISARAIIAASLLPDNINPQEFISHILRAKIRDGRVVNVPHRENPIIPSKWKKYFEGKTLLDPFAGFGSIPLEALRLGLSKVVAIELLPTAYIFLKAVLEYPLKYGEQLVKDIEKWGNWITEQFKKDPDIQELYDPDVVVYIGTWEIKCPHCGKWTPLIGNWWLARVKKGAAEENEEETGEGVRKGAYSRLAWMNYKIENGEAKITITDLNKELQAGELTAKVDAKQGRVIVGSHVYAVPKPNIDARRESATCLCCGNTIRYWDPETKRHYTDKAKLPQPIKDRLEWYVKSAIQSWNQNLEHFLKGEITLEQLPSKAYAKPKLIAKVKLEGKNLCFEAAASSDNERMWKALIKIKQICDAPDIPTEPIPGYEIRSIWVINYGFDKFFKLFNPRQLLTLIKLVKLIREAGKRVEEEKLKEGWSREEAFKYAEAVTTYLVIALCKFVEYSTVVSSYNAATNLGTISMLGSRSALSSFRGIAMVWNWCDLQPLGGFSNSFDKALKGVIDGLKYFVSGSSSSLSGGLLSYCAAESSCKSCEVAALIDDAASLNKLGGVLFDVIVTDPPYYDDVPYSELSDFYYIWLKRALSDVVDRRLMPRFHVDAFFKRIGARWVEVRTQWEEYARREVGLNVGRLGSNATLEDGKRYFLDLLKRAFIAMSERLVVDGLLVTYYAHTDPEAWEALLEAGWRAGGFKVTAAFPLITESAQRVTARGKVALDTSIIVVWRKGVSGEASADEVYREGVERGAGRALELIKSGYRGADLFIGTMASILGLYTRYANVVGLEGGSVAGLVKGHVYPATAVAIARALGRLAGRGVEAVEVRSSEGLFYLLAKTLFVRSPRARRRVLDRSSLIMLAIGTRSDEKALVNADLVRREGDGFHLLEPVGGDRDSLVVLLRERGVGFGLTTPVVRNSVDALHVLEYYALTYDKRTFDEKYGELRSTYAVFVEEAVSMAKVLRTVLPKGDPEASLCDRLVKLILGEVLA